MSYCKSVTLQYQKLRYKIFYIRKISTLNFYNRKVSSNSCKITASHHNAVTWLTSS